MEGIIPPHGGKLVNQLATGAEAAALAEEAKGLPKLRHLGLKNSEIADEIAKAVAGSKILKQLETLDLSMGTLSDAGAASLAAKASGFSHLARLDVSDNYLTKPGLAAVKKLSKKVESGKQRKPYEDDEESRRYVSVGE